jgi:single-stranded-DNA-specific exonuclease
MFFRRGLVSMDDVETFTHPLGQALPDPALLSGIVQAVELLMRARPQGSPVVVYGDYDADGITGTALLVSWLRKAGFDVEHYIPDRFEEGYGLNSEAVKHLWEKGKRLLLTVDCGTRALEEINLARQLGFQTIVTDHHHPHETLPPADVVVNPRLDPPDSPFLGLAGVGLAYMLASSLGQSMGMDGSDPGVDLVALGTVADLAPLSGLNRNLVARGLANINAGPRLGVAALMNAARIRPGSVLSSHIGYGLGPRLNAAGRMEHGDLGIQLMLTQDPVEAESLAEQLDELNRARQAETRAALERAEAHLGSIDTLDHVLFVVDEGFHEGVVGLVASRLVERFNRPALVGRPSEGTIRGSARSIEGFHITSALEAFEELLLEFGGHAAAAGFQIRESVAGQLAAGLNELAERQFGMHLPPRKLEVDSVVRLGDLDEGLLELLESMEPFGEANPPPLFAAFEVEIASARKVGGGGDHLKMTLVDGGRPFDAIAFRQGKKSDELRARADLVFHFEWNEFRGIRAPQLNVIDIRPAGTPPANR